MFVLNSILKFNFNNENIQRRKATDLSTAFELINITTCFGFTLINSNLKHI